MNWTERLSAVLDYIEDNLDGNVDIARAARIACCSPFYFQRLFLVITGISVSEYVRRRRLTLAAVELTSGKSRVIDVAMKYGYDSPDAFTRAFRNVHGITPQAARSSGTRLVAFPRISFQIALSGGSDMDYRMIEKPGFTIAAVVRQFTTVNEENFVKIPAWWGQFLASPECNLLTGLTGNKPGPITGGQMLGICIGEDVEFSYGIGVELPQGTSSGKYQKIEIPPAAWAVFDCTVSDIQDVTKRIFSEWFPSTSFEHDEVPELEVYLPGGKDDIMPVQIWIPVKKKE